MNSTVESTVSQQTLLIRFRATVQEELAVSDKVFHGLNDIGFNGHYQALTKKR